MAQAWLSRKARVMLLQPEPLRGLQRQVTRPEPEMMQRQQGLVQRLKRVMQPRLALLNQKLPVPRQSPKSQARTLKLQEPILKSQQQAELANRRDKQAPASRTRL